MKADQPKDGAPIGGSGRDSFSGKAERKMRQHSLLMTGFTVSSLCLAQVYAWSCSTWFRGLDATQLVCAGRFEVNMSMK